MAGFRSYGPQPYNTGSVWSGVEQGYRFGNALRGDLADQRAGRALAAGDYAGGANALLMNGDLEAGLKVQEAGRANLQRETAAQAAKKAEALKYIEQAASRLADIHRTNKDPAKTVAAFDQYFAPGFRDAGESEDEIAQFRAGLSSDPETTLMALGVGAAKQAGYELRSAGDEVIVIDPSTGREIRRFRGAKTVTLGPDTNLVEVPGTYGGADAPAQSNVPPPPEPPNASNTAPGVDAVWEAAKKQESGGRGDAIGPQTDYGRAEGSTQMLPATAEAMARKLGIAWNPALMRENSPRALEYQDRLGRAYFEEGLQKYGNVEDALRYYHGGPNEALWGPKTEAHVRAVMSRVQPYDVASNGNTPPLPGGARVIARGQPKPQEQWVDLPGGGQRNTATGKTEGVPKTSDRLSATVLKLQNDLLENIGVATSIRSTLDRAINQIDTGKLDFSVAGNVIAAGRNMVGMSDEKSRNFASFRASLEKLRNDSLRLNNGVQTEGDAIRAWNELISNLGDEALVRQRLAEIRDLNEQAVALKKDLVNQAREDSGFSPIDTSRFEAGKAINDPGKLRSDPGAIGAARDAIRRGADRNAVIQRLRQNGIDPAGL